MVNRTALVRSTFLVLALACACRHADLLAPVDGLGVVSGEWDGAAWRGYGYAVVSGEGILLVGHRPDPHYYYDEFVRAWFPFTGVGTYGVPDSTGALWKIVGGDAGEMPFAAGELRVTFADAGPRTLRGTLSLDAASRGWHFRLGTFDVPVYSSWALVPNVPGRPVVSP